MGYRTRKEELATNASNLFQPMITSDYIFITNLEQLFASSWYLTAKRLSFNYQLPSPLFPCWDTLDKITSHY